MPGRSVCLPDGANPINRVDPNGTDFIAIGDRKLGSWAGPLFTDLTIKVGSWFTDYMHYSLSYWEGNCGGPHDPQPAKQWEGFGLKKTAGVQLLVHYDAKLTYSVHAAIGDINTLVSGQRFEKTRS